MATKKAFSTLKSMLIFSLIATAFVTAISWASFDDFARVAIAAGLTFVVCMAGLAVLNWVSKEDETEPGKPRLK
jgi:Zn-dependent protease with chaperone function